MTEKEKMRELAKMYREVAEVLERIVENDDKKKEDMLIGEYAVKMIKIGMLME